MRKRRKAVYDVLNAYLENGLKIVLHKIPEVKTISCGLWIEQGSRNETEENNGLSHLAEHLVINPENSENLEFRELMKKVSAEGVIYNAATTKEYTCFYFTGLRNTLEGCISCLAHIAMRNRRFSENFFENEKKVVLQEATSFYSSFQQIKERTSQAIWGNVGTGKIIMGDMKNIREARPEQIQKLIEDNYVPENATIVVIGNVDYTQVLEMINRGFGDWEDKQRGAEEELVESLPGVYLNKGSGTNAVISIGFRAPSYRSSYRTAIEMMVRILGQSGMQARIVQEIRMKRGLAYNVGGFSSFYKNRGTLGFMAVCDKDKAIETAKVMMDVFLEVKEKGFTEEEIEREKKIMETATLLSVENITDHLRNIGKCSVMGNSFYIENEVRMIHQVSAEDLKKMIDELLIESNMGVAAIGGCDFDELLDAVAFG